MFEFCLFEALRGLFEPDVDIFDVFLYNSSFRIVFTL